MLDDRPASTRQQQAHGPRRARRVRRGRPPLSSRLVMSLGLTAALLGAGILVGTGTVRTPLSDSGTVQPPRSATVASSPSATLPAANSFSYALASVPASSARHAQASPKAAKASPKAAKPAKPAEPEPSATASASVPAPSTPAATPSAAPSTSAALLTPQPTAEYQTPSGQNQLAWSEAILTALGAPLSSANIVSIGYWMQNEAGKPPYGIVGANNPINVSEPGYGGVPIQSDGDGVTYLMSYPTVADGVAAIAAYLERGNYVDIVADLKAGVGLSDPSLAPEIEEFAGDHYSTIPDSYGLSQGTPES